MQRALLVEIVNADQFPGRINYAFPFVCGYLAAQRVPTRWLRFGISTTNQMEHQRDEITLSGKDLERLLEVICEHTPTHVVMTDPLHRPQMERLRAAVPQAWFHDRGRATPVFPGLRPYRGTSELEHPSFEPHYDWEPGNLAATNKETDNIYLAQPFSCGHRLTLGSNPVYSAVQVPGGWQGCAFCMNWAGTRERSTADPLVWIEKQLWGIARSRGRLGRLPHAVLLESVASPALLRRCVEVLDSTGMAGKVQLLTAVRTNQMGDYAKVVDEHFVAHPESPQRFGVYASGIESFVAEDLQRFNKGTTPLDGIRAINTLRRLKRAYPARFWFTGTSFILFHPWTTAETLHLNLGLVRLLNVCGQEGGNVLQSRLRLHDRLPITALAARDGLIAEAESDPLLIMSRRKLFEREQPWRFRDQRLRPVSRIALRFELMDKDIEDPLLCQMKEAMARAGVPAKRENVIDLILAMTEIAWAEKRPLDEEDLLGRALAQRDQVNQPELQRTERRWRVAGDRLTLAQYVRRVLPLLDSRLKPVLSVERVSAPDIDSDLTELLGRWGGSWALVDHNGRRSRSAGTLLLGLDSSEVARRADLEPLLSGSAESRRAVVLEAARLSGVPECCASAWTKSPWCDLDAFAWAALTRRHETDGAIPLEIDPWRVEGLGFVPCEPGCTAAALVYREWFDRMGVRSTDAMVAYMVALGGHDESVPLQVVAYDESGLRYRLDGGDAGAGSAHARLSRGNAVRVLPGQIQVLRDDTVIDFMTRTHGIWFAKRSWHGAFWRELGLGFRVGQDQPSAGSGVGSGQGARLEVGSRLSFLLDRVVERISTPEEPISEQRLGTDGLVIRLHVVLGSDPYELVLEAKRSDRPSLFQTNHFNVSHEVHTPVRTRAVHRKLMALVGLLDRAISAYAPECLLKP